MDNEISAELLIIVLLIEQMWTRWVSTLISTFVAVCNAATHYINTIGSDDDSHDNGWFENNHVKCMDEEVSASYGGDKVSEFDYSIQNHFTYIDSISKLFDGLETDLVDQSDIQRVSSSVTFLREWKIFNYEPRIVRFVDESAEHQNKPSIGVKLPQFSSVAVAQKEELAVGTTSDKPCNDFVMYVGGSVWALDWLPRVRENPDSPIKCEFIAIAAHPPGSFYHKIGAPLTGRGIIQIWCMLNVGSNVEDPPTKTKSKRVNTKVQETEDGMTRSKKAKGRPRKHPFDDSLQNEDKVKRPRGRPKKHPIVEVLNLTDSGCQFIQPVDTQHPGSSLPLSIESTHGEDGSISKSTTKSLSQSRRKKGKTDDKSHLNNQSMVVFNPDEPIGSSPRNLQVDPIGQQAPTVCSSVVNSSSFEVGLSSCVQDNNVLPRIVFCLAHNGKVAWDVKWQPRDMDDSAPKQRLGYLAVLLGGGSLEVWEVPGPRLIKQIYSKHHEVGTDPRFLRLKPVFKFSRVDSGGLQSIPLTVEWSTFPPHDYLLAGCHDGTVALWKFSPKNTVEESRPILCFSADTAPIKSVAWAPAARDMESANIVATAGHGCPKFWDIRDPHRPLWDFHATSRFSYSLDWAANPKYGRCIIQSYDDGTMRLVSLVKAAHDIAATGKHFTGTKQQGLHQFSCSSFAIWSVHVSRLTGMVAYCGQDGTVKYFQLTSMAVDKEFSRNRAPHFLCWSLCEEDRAIVVKTPAMNVPLFLKKPVSDANEGSRSMRSYLSENQVKSASSREHSLVSLDDQPLVEETDMDETLTTIRKGKRKNNSEVRRDEGIVKVESKVQEEAKKEVEAFPPKMVAVHKVRWNMNKGSERWLCSGGAAGIVRCQEIKLPNFDKTLAWQQK